MALLIVVGMMSACKNEKKNFVDDVENAHETPTMFTRNVETFISDSGITRYRITAPIWNIYEDAKVPRWTFPEGLFLEQFDNDFQQNAKVECDSATYFSNKRMWRLDGNVVMVNVARDSFLTRQLFWDQQHKRIFSDTSFIRIVSEDRIIEGYGFSANEQVTEYSIKHPTAIFSVDNLRHQQDSVDVEDADTIDTPDEATTTKGATPLARPGLKLANNANQQAISD
ncbi:MAG: LPS export ABC transporter periplasmic protein LptC [Muribaculaceae bacterium]|nr:LPS export ABC transporter periplasmic protein LptC [Muribaculaceae bacterium]